MTFDHMINLNLPILTTDKSPRIAISGYNAALVRNKDNASIVATNNTTGDIKARVLDDDSLEIITNELSDLSDCNKVIFLLKEVEV